MVRRAGCQRNNCLRDQIDNKNISRKFYACSSPSMDLFHIFDVLSGSTPLCLSQYKPLNHPLCLSKIFFVIPHLLCFKYHFHISIHRIRSLALRRRHGNLAVRTLSERVGALVYFVFCRREGISVFQVPGGFLSYT
jgi:hypothetical protein